MVRVNGSTVIYERGDFGFDQAWNDLISVGLNPREWMYMESDEKPTPERTVHGFKNIRTRRYVWLKAS